jgi:hypothetical protein
VFARFGLQRAPVCDDVGPIAVNLEPRDGFREDCTMKQRALRPRRSLGVQQTRLHGEDLLQPFDVTPGDRKQAQFDPPFECVGREAPASQQPEWVQQRSRQDRIG